MRLRRLLPTCLIAALLGGVSAGAWAAPPADHGRPDRGRSDLGPRRGDDPLSDSVRRVERMTRSQVLSAERVPFDGRDVNRIKTLDDQGRVRVFMDDPSVAPPPRGRNPPTRGNDD
jgi:hypothetical protein